MPEYNRPDRNRLKRVHVRIEKALDELSRAAGETRPAQFATVRASLQGAINTLESLASELDGIDGPGEPVVNAEGVMTEAGLSADDLDEDEIEDEAA